MAYTVISSVSNERVKALRPLFGDAGERARTGLFTAEGLKLCEELFQSNLAVTQLWFTEQNETAAKQLLAAKGCEPVLMSDAVASRLTDAKSPQGIFAVGVLPNDQQIFTAKRAVVLCSVQDPLNVGAIIRSAAALGFDAAAVCGSSADAFSPKALRGAMGAQFRIPVARFESGEGALSQLVENGFTAVAAALAENAVSLRELSISLPLALAVGNESRGLSEPELRLCTPCIIPMKNGVNSLNAAAAATLFMWQLAGE